MISVSLLCCGLLALAAIPLLRAAPASLAALSLFVVPGLACLVGGRRGAGWYGLRTPRGAAGWALLPIALAAAACGGIWLPPGAETLARAARPDAALAAFLASAAGLELLFRGLAQAGLLRAFHGRARGVPVVLPALLYAAALALLPSAAAPWGEAAGGAAAALLFGLVSGLARERAQSVALPLAFALLGAAARLACLAFGIPA